VACGWVVGAKEGAINLNFNNFFMVLEKLDSSLAPATKKACNTRLHALVIVGVA
jgi:hypothetical protein